MDIRELRARLEARAATSTAGPVDAKAIIRKVRRRRQRRGLVGLTVALAAAGTSVALLTTGSTSHKDVQSLVPSGSAAASPTTPATPTPPRTPTPTARASLAPLPEQWQRQAPTGSFIGLVGAGAERAAVIDLNSGQVLRYLQKEGNQALLVRFGGEAVQSAAAGLDCRYNYQLVPTETAGTAAVAAPTGIGQLVDGGTPQRYAYQLQRPGGTYYLPGGRTVLGGCGAAPSDLVLVDRATNQQRRWSGYQKGELFTEQLRTALDFTGQRLAYFLNGQLRVLDVNGDEKRLDEGRLIDTPSNSTISTQCLLTQLHFQPGTRTVWAAEQCYTGTFLAAYDTANGRLTERRQVAAAGTDIDVSSFDVDPSGNIIGTLGNSQWASDRTDGRVFVSRAGSAVETIPGFSVYQALW